MPQTISAPTTTANTEYFFLTNAKIGHTSHHIASMAIITDKTIIAGSMEFTSPQKCYLNYIPYFGKSKCFFAALSFILLQAP
jgi:hypothetical protein